MSKATLTFKRFQALNRRRCETSFKMNEDTPFVYWSNALAGEAGELCNWVKKNMRDEINGRPIPPERIEKIKKELADIITYADLALSFLGQDTESVLREKFNEVSRRDEVSSDILL